MVNAPSSRLYIKEPTTKLRTPRVRGDTHAYYALRRFRANPMTPVDRATPGARRLIMLNPSCTLPHVNFLSEALVSSIVTALGSFSYCSFPIHASSVAFTIITLSLRLFRFSVTLCVLNCLQYCPLLPPKRHSPRSVGPTLARANLGPMA